MTAWVRRIEQRLETAVFDKTYSLKWYVYQEGSRPGTLSAHGRTSSGKDLSISFDVTHKKKKKYTIQVEFDVDGTMAVTDGGDAYTIFATVIQAFKEVFDWRFEDATGRSSDLVRMIIIRTEEAGADDTMLRKLKIGRTRKGRRGYKRDKTPSRVKLYRRMLHLFAPKYGFRVGEIVTKDYVDFKLRRK